MNRRTCLFLLLALLPRTGTAQAAGPEFTRNDNTERPDTLPDDPYSFHDRLHNHSADSDAAPMNNEAKPIVMIEPKYPDAALEACIGGWLLYELWVDKKGRVTSTQLIAQDRSGLFSDAGKRELRRWRIKPMLRDGEPVTSRTLVSIEFELPGGCTDGAGKPSITINRSRDSLKSWPQLGVDAPDGVTAADIVYVPIFNTLIGDPFEFGLLVQKWNKGKSVLFDFASLAQGLAVARRRSTDEDLRPPPGIKLTNQDAWFARIATFAKGDSLMQSRFIDEQNKREVLLVYAPSKFEVTGAQAIPGGKLHYDLQFPGLGYFWVALDAAETPGEFEAVVLKNANLPRLQIFPDTK